MTGTSSGTETSTGAGEDPAGTETGKAGEKREEGVPTSLLWFLMTVTGLLGGSLLGAGLYFRG